LRPFGRRRPPTMGVTKVINNLRGITKLITPF
jgi:hypothetical protein